MNSSIAVNEYAHRLKSAYEHQEIVTQVAWWLLEKATGKGRSQLLLVKTIPHEAHQQVQMWIDQIVHGHKPVQYILGSVPFLDLEILVQPPILIPRPETEFWCHHLLTQLRAASVKDIRILDLCSGTGCIALSLAKGLPAADVTAVDINPQARDLIELNKEKNELYHCTALVSDLFTQLPRGTKYNIITANPPYISQKEWQALEPRIKEWEDPVALIAPHEGLEIIERIVQHASMYLDAQIDAIAQVWIEVGSEQADTVVQCFKDAGYTHIRVLKDQYGKDRVITGDRT